jgi:hypothetical protein
MNGAFLLPLLKIPTFFSPPFLFQHFSIVEETDWSCAI